MISDRPLIVSSSPHTRTDENTRSIMLDVIIALTPALVLAVYYFGFRALLLTLVSVAACITFEFLWQKLMKKTIAVGDLSAIVTGMLIAYNIPASAPYWLPVVGALFAIIVVKQLYGGIGKNFMNPALAARAFLFSWPGIMSSWPAIITTGDAKLQGIPLWGDMADVVTAATPLVSLRREMLPQEDFFQLLLGSHGGSLGETSAIVLLLGGAYLVIRKVISPRIPLCYIGTVALITFLTPPENIAGHEWMLAHVLSGGLMLGAIFMATDYSTSPVTKWGQVIFGIGCGLLTVFIRYFGSYVEGVSYSILIMNACVWVIDKIARPRRYGKPLFGGRFRKAGAGK
ncbi:RnfABCDGE type electron transport complex subunit D [Oscillospiraceae bacterium OttesenSCG-928-F05]|nr:RnfABCDGE type electron transport complex subunit D [Oscillospiraceae bacterium OttesenSCG-928-F05]